MHACEAYIAAYEATDDRSYLARAGRIARRITVDLAAETDGLLWEHYTDEWEHDIGYNADEPRHQFRPPGYQPGHHVEWAKLLALLDRYGAGNAPDGGWDARAMALFEAGVDLGWTDGGFAYTVDTDGEVVVADRYGWALAEGIGAAAALAERAVNADDEGRGDRVRSWHERFLDAVPDYRGPAGVWYEKRLAAEAGGDPVAPAPPGVEPDYHPAGAYYESWRSARLVADRRE
jgi:mannose/cellobiose epimerase-like protein (N-acyl-D-glucosamine 2-epimerase family)